MAGIAWQRKLRYRCRRTVRVPLLHRWRKRKTAFSFITVVTVGLFHNAPPSVKPWMLPYLDVFTMNY